MEPKILFIDSWKWFLGIIILAIISLIAFNTVKLYALETLPFKNGRYVTDQKYCSYNDKQISNLGDQVAFHFRTLSKGKIYNHYETTCEIADVRVLGKDVVFNSICEAEGEMSKSRSIYLKLSDTSFESEGTVFTRCEPSFESQLSTIEITDIQNTLIVLKFNPGLPDGKLGPKTRRAINNYRRKNSISESSMLDKLTFENIMQNIQGGGGAVTPYQKSSTKKFAEVAPAENQNKTDLDNKNFNALSNEELKNQFLLQSNLLENLRTRLISNPDHFYLAMKPRQGTAAANILRDKMAIERLIGASAGFVACWDSPATVYGYYNVVQNIWSIFWVNKQKEILKARLSHGFSPVDELQKNAWFELYSTKVSVLEAIQKSFTIQKRAFSLLFAEIECALDTSKIDYVFVDNEAAISLLRNEQTMRTYRPEFLNRILSGFKNKLDLDDAKRASLDFVWKVPGTPKFDYLSFHTFLPNRYGIAIQAWEEAGGEVKALRTTIGILGNKNDDK